MKMSVLFSAPQIPAGMGAFQWSPEEQNRNREKSRGMRQE